jgi:hypothetical protein
LWALVQRKPKHSDYFDCVYELVKVERLDNVCIDPKRIASLEISILPRGGHHHDWDVLEPRFTLELSQYFQSVQTWHLEIQQDYCRVPVLATRKLPTPKHVVERFNAVAQDRDFVGQVVLFERVQRKLSVLGAIIYEQNAFGFHGSSP